MSKKKLQALLTDQDYQVTDEITGQVYAVLSKGKKQMERLTIALKEEHCCDSFKISDVEKLDGIGFTINSKEDGVRAYVKLLTAHIY